MDVNSQQISVLLFILSVLIASISQILLKISANRLYPSRYHEYFNPFVLTAYLIFFISSFMTIQAYRQIPLSWGPPLESLNYLFIFVLSYFILGEKANKRQLFGFACIFFGIIIIIVAQ